MSKDTYYFPHDYEPTSDPKIQALIGEYGAAGYGIYWRVVEMLHSDINHKLPFKNYVFLAIAKQMLANAEQTQAIINYCISPCELLTSDTATFWSERVLRNIEARTQLSEKRSIAGKAGAIAKQTLANSSKGKESKGKENKERYIVPPTFEMVKSYCELRNNGIDPQYFIDQNTTKGWVYGKAKLAIKDWQACIRTWERFQKKNKADKIPA